MPALTTHQAAPVFELTYGDYLANAPGLYNWEAGARDESSALTEGQWNALSLPERFSAVGGRLVITPDDPRFEAMNERVGDPSEPNRNIVVAIGNPDEAYRPDWIRDPDRIARGDGWYAISDTNLTPDYGRAQETRSRRMQQRAAIAAAALVTGGLAYGALAGGAAGAAGAGEAAGLGLTAEGTAGIGAGATGAGAIDLGATGAAVGAAEGATSLGTQAAAPVVDLSVPATGSPYTGPGSGIINGARGAWDATTGWYNSLGPAGRFVVNQAISSGAQALSSGAAQRAAQEAADEREERARQDRIRRGSVPAVVNPYTPRPAGIIGSAFTPRPGGG